MTQARQRCGAGRVEDTGSTAHQRRPSELLATEIPIAQRNKNDEAPPAGVPQAARLSEGSELFASLFDAFVERVADRIVDKLRGGHLSGFVDQSESPLGRRRHIQAVRSGQLPGVRVGRRYLVRQEDLERFVAARSGAVPTGRDSTDRIDALAAELGHKRRQ